MNRDFEIGDRVQLSEEGKGLEAWKEFGNYRGTVVLVESHHVTVKWYWNGRESENICYSKKFITHASKKVKQ